MRRQGGGSQQRDGGPSGQTRVRRHSSQWTAMPAYNDNRCGRAAVGKVRCTGLVACTRSRVAMAEVVDDPHAWCGKPTNPVLTSAMG